ncbi:hypothetical protein GCK72_008020 [Caenorhabditis remanei]|uniref:F-box associated domain-containing protein n=1 Tax=Caenorhabditis remanei TaxID=31234 RepID=A0A6A5HKM9_CAERE|nr:hypothetical protein GCK72_008020 [Caenorhabditis remanei]KAF1768059.1 hypothetical protein GCK72_008020 [Caenorhabditis remanei]
MCDVYSINLDTAIHIHITSRSPALQRIDKIVPLRINILVIQKGNLAFDNNQSSVSLLKNKELVFYCTVGQRYNRGSSRSRWYVPTMQHIFEYYLGGRTVIYVDHLGFGPPVSDLNLPETLNMRINKLATTYCEIEPLLPIIDPLSFPLTELRTVLEGVNTFEHPVFLTAKRLIFGVEEGESSNLLTEVHKIQNKDVTFEYDNFEEADPIKIIKHWMESGKDIGTTFVYTGLANRNLDTIFPKLEKEFGEFLTELDETIDQLISERPQFEIPINSESNILVYGAVPQLDWDYKSQLVLKVVPAT